jgi:hypothetical protein
MYPSTCQTHIATCSAVLQSQSEVSACHLISLTMHWVLQITNAWERSGGFSNLVLVLRDFARAQTPDTNRDHLVQLEIVVCLQNVWLIFPKK